jgi:glycosyltransferase involved in cell wall biosynthesis
MPEFAKPKVSVITVCLNAAEVIGKTLISVKEQTYSNIEYIVVDGGSTDGTIKLCNERLWMIDIFISEPDKGLYDAMNKGIMVATGDLIIFLNAGDHFVCADALFAFVSKVKLDVADIFFGKILWVDSDCKHVTTSEHDHIKFRYQLQHDNFPHPATLYKRNIFNKIGLFNVKYTIFADYEWNLRALIEYNLPFIYLNSIVSTFYKGGISTVEYMKMRRKIIQHL